jgi:hypothetical protein
MQPRVLLDGLAVPESPRWHHDRLWFSNDLGRPCFATMLGGADRRTLFMLTADWRGTEGIEAVIRSRTGRILVADAPAPGVGWP